MIKQCTCPHTVQDAKHGKGMRVHNRCMDGKNELKAYRCTVCGRVKNQ